MMMTAGRASVRADRSRESALQPLADSLHGGAADISDAPTSPPQSAFAAEEVQSPAAKAAAAKRSASVAAAPEPAAGASAAGSAAPALTPVPRGSQSTAALPAPSLAARLDAGTGVLASSQVLVAGRTSAIAVTSMLAQGRISLA